MRCTGHQRLRRAIKGAGVSDTVPDHPVLLAKANA